MATLWTKRLIPERHPQASGSLAQVFRKPGRLCWKVTISYKTNAQIAKELKITPILDKLLEYKRNWIQHINRMPRNRLPKVMKRYSPTGRRNHGSPLKRLLDTWDRNGSTSGPTPWQIYDDDDDDDVTISISENKSMFLFYLQIIIHICPTLVLN